MQPLPDFAASFVVERKGRALVYRAEVGQTRGGVHTVSKIEMGVSLPPHFVDQMKARQSLRDQVRDLWLHLILGGDVPRHLTAERHQGRRIAAPQISAEVEAELRAQPA